MVMNDTLAAALSKIDNAQRSEKNVPVEVLSSKITRQVLDILKSSGYVASFDDVKTAQGSNIKVTLEPRINKVGVIKPRFPFKIADSQRVEKQYLPARDFGVIIVSTSQGIMTLEEAKSKKIGGKLIAFCY